ncbi:hypothetical protein DRN62_02345 [Nanoarchaeota archaeon]|nr:MAG: hypothetical protein DRN62_02345 [Nanoarchaeota archaeon]
MKYRVFLYALGSTIGAGFFMFFPYAHSLVGEQFVYAMFFSFFLVLFLSIFYLRLEFPPWGNFFVFTGEVIWVAACSHYMGILAYEMLGLNPIFLSNLLLLSLLVIQYFGWGKQLERFMVTFIILFLSVLLTYSGVSIHVRFEGPNPNFLRALPISFVLFMGFERVAEAFPGKKEKVMLSSLALSLVIYFFLVHTYSEEVLRSELGLPFFIIIVAIVLASMNSSLFACEKALQELSRMIALPRPITRSKPFFLFVLISLLISISSTEFYLFSFSSIYITYFLSLSLVKRSKWSLLSVPLVLHLLTIPSQYILLSLLLLPLIYKCQKLPRSSS